MAPRAQGPLLSALSCSVRARQRSAWCTMLLHLPALLGLTLFACTHPSATLAVADSSHDGSDGSRAGADHGASPSAWHRAARVNDWSSVAKLIDAMPAARRTEPATRYVRAFAGLRLGDCDAALAALDGLAEALPELGDEVETMTAECWLEVGPFAEA